MYIICLISFSHFLCSLTRTPPNTPPHLTAQTRAALRAPTLPTAVSLLWMVWNTPWMAESEKQLMSTQTLHFNRLFLPFPSIQLGLATKCQDKVSSSVHYPPWCDGLQNAFSSWMLGESPQQNWEIVTVRKSP